MSEAISDYFKAQKAVPEAHAKLKKIAEIVFKAGDGLKAGHRMISVIHIEPPKPGESVQPGTPLVIDAREWPTASDIKDALEVCRRAEREVERTWNSLSRDEQDGLKGSHPHS